MSDSFSVQGPLWRDAEQSIVWTSDGNGGLVLTSVLLGVLTVTASNLTDPETAGLIARLSAAEDIPDNWALLSARLGGDSTETWDEQGG